MQRLAADDAAERDRALVRLAAALGGIERDGDGRRHLERARHAHAIEDRTSLAQRAPGAGEQGVGDVLVEARLHDEEACARKVTGVASARTGAGGSARLSHHVVSRVALVVPSGSGCKQASGDRPLRASPAALSRTARMSAHEKAIADPPDKYDERDPD